MIYAARHFRAALEETASHTRERIAFKHQPVRPWLLCRPRNDIFIGGDAA